MLYLLSTSCVLTLASSLLFPHRYATAAQFLPTRGSSSSATRTTRTSRCSSPSRRPCGALLSFGEFLSYLYFASAVSDTFVINIINNIRIRFTISFYVICAMIYCSFCCIYMWLDPGTYMIARFMSFCKPGVTTCWMAVWPMFCLPWPIAHVSQLFSSYHGSFAPKWT